MKLASLPCAAFVLALAACSSSGSRSIVEMPTYAPAVAQPVNVNTLGAIYQAGSSVSLYETSRAQKVGDVLTIRLAESYQGSNSADASASRASSISAEAADKSSGAAARLARLFNVGSADTSFKGNGSTSNLSRDERHAGGVGHRHLAGRQSRGRGRQDHRDERQSGPAAILGHR